MSRLAFFSSLPRDAKIIIFSNAVRTFSSAILAVSFPIYLKFGVGPAEIGLVTGLGRLIATFSYTLGLRMAKRFGTIKATASAGSRSSRSTS